MEHSFLNFTFFSEDIDTYFRRLLVAGQRDILLVSRQFSLLFISIFSSLNIVLVKSKTFLLITILHSLQYCLSIVFDKKLMDYHPEIMTHKISADITQKNTDMAFTWRSILFFIRSWTRYIFEKLKVKVENNDVIAAVAVDLLWNKLLQIFSFFIKITIYS